MAKKVIVGGRIESKEVGGIVTGAAEILDDTKGKKQSVINQETDNELARLDQSKQDNLTFDNVPTEGSNNPVKSAGVYAADKALSDAIEVILLLIPGAASALNKLVDMATMNSSISTATATFKGTYNVVTDLELAIDATHEQIAAKLAQVVSEADNNDYAFVQIPVSAESTDIRRTERYKFNGTAWEYEYDLNTSGFTAAQWAAINSGITIALVAKLNGLPTSSELMALLGQKQDMLTFDNIPTSGSANPVKSGGVYEAINDEKTAREQLAQTVTGIDGRVGDVEEVIPTGAAANNQLVANSSMEAYVASIIQNITASFTIATADGHINLTLTQTNGRVASLTLTSSDIASAQALTALTGRVSTAEGNITALNGNITTLGGRVSTNENDIANLQQLYNNLQQSKPVPVTALPETGQQQGVIYRLAGTTSYSDYMWNGSTWVLMATYNNAIDDVPTAGSDNLVKSGGVAEMYGNYVDNPEWVWVVIDSKKRILGGFMADGRFEYNTGVPTPIRRYIDPQLDSLVTEISKKVDKEEGKGLVIVDFAEGVSYETNPEWVFVKLDADGRIISGVKSDGTTFISKLEVGELVGIDEFLKDYINDYYNVSKHCTTPTVITIYTSAPGWEQVAYGPSYSIYEEEGIYNVDDTCNIDGDTEHSYKSLVSQQGNYPALKETKKVITEKLTLDTALAKIPSDILNQFEAGQVITFVNDEDIVEKWELQSDGTWERINPYEAFNLEYMKLELDAEDKIISSRKKDGTLVENIGIRTNNLTLTEKGMSDFQKALKDAGFSSGTGNWSDYISNDGESPLHIPVPRIAFLNIISGFDLTQLSKKGYNSASMEGVNYDIPTQVEYCDNEGNYFKKWTLMSAQGSSSMGYEKKNLAFDFFDKEVNGDAFAVRFGDWVPQDSFHFKAFVADFFKGLSFCCYQIAEEVANTRGILADTQYKRAVMPKYNFDACIYKSEQVDDLAVQTDNGAKCQPDGFPCIVYQNGEFYGIYVLGLKKHRDNYVLSKKKAKNIHIDGEFYTHKLWDGDIDWTTFEVRNPKNLYYKEAHVNTENGQSTYEYDSDNPGQFEIADAETVAVWIQAGQLPDGTVITSKIQGYLEVTAQVHTYITQAAGRLAEIEAAATTEEKKALIEQYFDVPSLIDYELIQCAVVDPDSIFNNCQWVTWDGKKWFPCEYDKDDTFGNHAWCNMPRTEGSWTYALFSSSQIADKSPIGLVRKYYQAEAKERWQELVDAGIFTKKHFLEIIRKWMLRIGTDFYTKEYAKWSDSNSDRSTNINTDYWQYVTNEYNSSVPYYDATASYTTGQRCRVNAGSGYSHIFECVQDCNGEAPLNGAIGWRGSMGQLDVFIQNNFEKENTFFASL